MTINASTSRASDRLLRPKKVAETLEIGLTTLRHLEYEGLLIPLHVGHGRGVRRYTAQSVLDYIQGCERIARRGHGSPSGGRPRAESGADGNVTSHGSRRLRRVSDGIHAAGKDARFDS